MGAAGSNTTVEDFGRNPRFEYIPVLARTAVALKNPSESLGRAIPTHAIFDHAKPEAKIIRLR